MEFWITYIEVKALYPFITDEMLADAFEREHIEARPPKNSIVPVNSKSLDLFRYNKRSIVEYFLPLYEEIKTRSEVAKQNTNEETLPDIMELIEKSGLIIQALKESVLDKSAPSVVGEEDNHAIIGLSKKEVKERRFRQAEAFVIELRENAELGGREIAQQLKGHYPDLSYAEIGRLLPATPGCPGGYDCQKSQGQRLLGVKK